MKTGETATCILFVRFEGRPEVLKSIKITSSLTVQVFVGSNVLDDKHYNHLLNNGLLTCWSQLENMISLVKSKSLDEIELSAYDAVLKNMKVVVDENKGTDRHKCAQFFFEQLVLFSKPKNARRYSTDMYRFAACLYVISPTCYKALLSCKLLTLPCVDSLKKLLNVLSLNTSTISTENMHYIKSKCEKLGENEKLVNLLIDEIHIKPKITFKGRKVSGFAANAENCEATSVQAFMISSIFSSYKDVVALVPVSGMSAQDLHILAKQALNILFEAGFDVCAIVSDNNSVNRNMFSTLASGKLSSTPISNPVNGARLYLLFDPVHLLKSIRNNWLNQSDSEKTFICPDFSGEREILKPRFGLLRKAFLMEKSSPIKYTFKLNVKSLYPTIMERQNVLPAVNIFHESNPVALQRLAEQPNSKIHTVDDTVKFLKWIKRWWNILNVSHQNKGIFTKNPDSLPLANENADNFTFLASFVKWAIRWQEMKLTLRHGCLSKETFYALIHTTSTIINVSKDLLKDGAKYVLTAKFHSDALEFRFSQYRQMSGANYHVSLQQILESERKLRVKSLLKMHSNHYGDITLRLFFNEFCFESEEIDVSPFSKICEDIDLIVSNSDSEILTYIAGYCVYKLKVTCVTCKEFYLSPFDLSVDFDNELLSSPSEKDSHSAYLDMIDRGGMKIPSSDIIFTLSACFVIFQKLISIQYEKLFLALNVKQHTTLVKLTELYLKQCSVFDFEQICSECKICFSKGILKIIHIFSNVCLNNYSKLKVDDIAFKKITKRESKEMNVKNMNFGNKRLGEKNTKCENRKLMKFSE